MLLNPYRFGVAASSLLTSLESYWKFDEASGNAIDAHGANHLTAVNAPGTAAGKVGSARTFDGTNHSFERVSGASLSTGDIDFTFSLWLYATNISQARALISKWDATTQEFLIMVGSGNFLDFAIYGPSGTKLVRHPIATPTSNIWYHVLAWHDAANNQIAVSINNGTPVVLAASGGAIALPAKMFYIGRQPGDANWYGRLDEIGFWKRMLTPAERTELYNGGNGKTHPFT